MAARFRACALPLGKCVGRTAATDRTVARPTIPSWISIITQDATLSPWLGKRGVHVRSWSRSGAKEELRFNSAARSLPSDRKGPRWRETKKEGKKRSVSAHHSVRSVERERQIGFNREPIRSYSPKMLSSVSTFCAGSDGAAAAAADEDALAVPSPPAAAAAAAAAADDDEPSSATSLLRVLERSR